MHQAASKLTIGIIIDTSIGIKIDKTLTYIYCKACKLMLKHDLYFTLYFRISKSCKELFFQGYERRSKQNLFFF
ncbi:hypothetical protein BpHYR1_001522 [Brachionus plicatilis]|uniref:Uncharacterized protein n=1 Tax=Brachionus plicatilis TaxID=10195 RepID=A0A3M7P8X0_BRAPC|nr:hypothetical protein BpHYR1_001522 [Brachionus plicatilis]